MKCNKCNYENDDLNKFCENCGNNLNKRNKKKNKFIVIVIICLILFTCCYYYFSPKITSFLVENLFFNNHLLDNLEHESNTKSFKEILTDDDVVLDSCSHSYGSLTHYNKQILYKNKRTNKYFVAGYDESDKKRYKFDEFINYNDRQNYVNEFFSSYNNIYFKLYEYEKEENDNDGAILHADLKIIIDTEKYNKNDIKAIEEKIDNDYDKYDIYIFFAKDFKKSSFDLYEMFLTSQYAFDCSDDFGNTFVTKHKNVLYEEIVDENDYDIAEYYISNNHSYYNITLEEYIKNKFDTRRFDKNKEYEHWYD